MNLLGGRPWVTVAAGTFRYAYGQVPEDPDWGAWLFTFHSTAFGLVVLSKDDHQKP